MIEDLQILSGTVLHVSDGSATRLVYELLKDLDVNDKKELLKINSLGEHEKLLKMIEKGDEIIHANYNNSGKTSLEEYNSRPSFERWISDKRQL